MCHTKTERIKSMEARSSSSNSAATRTTKMYIGQILETASLSTEDLQVNFSSDSSYKKFRSPSSITCIPTPGVVVIGFDSGEVQTYQGLKKDGSLVAGPCFKIGTSSVLFVKALEDWSPFQHEKNEDFWSVFYAATSSSDLFLFWVVNKEVCLSRLKFEIPSVGSFKVTDAILGRGMHKIVVSTDKGRLIVFPAVVKDRLNDVGQLADEQVESKHVQKVAHEGEVTALSVNGKGDLIVSGGRDGKVCIWQWGRDEFLHQVAQIYLTNLPILSVLFNDPLKDTDITVAIETYIMNLKVTKRTSQLYFLQQNPKNHIKLKGRGKASRVVRISNGNDLYSFMTLRSNKSIEINSAIKPEHTVKLDDRETGLCIDQQKGQGNIYTLVSLKAGENEPVVFVWHREDHL